MECLLIGEYTYLWDLWGGFRENPQIALCELCRKRVPSTQKEPCVQPSKTPWQSDSVSGTENQKHLCNLKGGVLSWLSFHEICSAEHWSPQLEGMKRPSASDVPNELPVLGVCLAVAYSSCSSKREQIHLLRNQRMLTLVSKVTGCCIKVPPALHGSVGFGDHWY